MYKLLLCWRYLLTRYLALACIISVMLGVATLIVVNSVMGGFSSKLRERLHALLSDVVIEASSLEGFSDPQGKMAKIKNDPFLKDKIAAMTPTMEVFAMLQFNLPRTGQVMTRAIRLVGIDPVTRSAVGGFKQHLKLQNNAEVPSFELSREAMDLYLWRNPLALPQNPQVQGQPPVAPIFFPDLEQTEKGAEPKPVPPPAKPKIRLELPGLAAQIPMPMQELQPPVPPIELPPLPNEKQSSFKPGQEPHPFDNLPDHPPGQPATAPVAQEGGPLPPPVAPPRKMKMPRGIFIGNLIASFRTKKKDAQDEYEELQLLLPGDEVIITTVSGGKLAPVYDSFVVVDFFKSEMSEYDSNYCFVPLDYLQHLRSMDDRVTSIQLRLKDYDKDAKAVVDRLRELFPEMAGYRVDSWEGKQGPLLAAIQIEKGILNVLLFLIIAVAGFGILAIFSMIVTEKTRDIGIMKALGASNKGVMTIFLTYGLLLGLVGAGLGTVLGVNLTVHINDVERWISSITGNDVFDRSVYYFNEIPTEISFWNVAFLNLGSVAIAVFFSVMPALRAAWLHPVRALRYE